MRDISEDEEADEDDDDADTRRACCRCCCWDVVDDALRTADAPEDWYTSGVTAVEGGGGGARA
jgi:hypothetical protein